MYCYDEKGELLGVIACIPKEGEEHLWGDTAYVCTGEVTIDKGCRENGMIFKKVSLPKERGRDVMPATNGTPLSPFKK